MTYLDSIKNKRQEKEELDKEKALVKSFSDVSSDIRTLLASLETSGAKKLDKQVVSAISSLGTIVEALSTLKVEGDSEVKETLSTIASTLSNLDIRPVVNVPKAQITVKERDIDFDPLIQAINKETDSDDDPLVGYKAQDINSDDPHTQYVGFVNAEGNWYIIENNDNTNSLRYKFGIKDYPKAFKEASKLNYKLYSEAISEVKA